MQHEGGRKGDDDTSVEYAVLKHRFACAHELRNGADEDDAQNGQRNARDDDESNQQGEDAVCPFLLSASQLFGDERAAARADYEAHAAENHDERHNEVQCGEGRFADIVGDEKTIHNVVNRGKDHHQDGRRDEFEQAGIGEVIGKLNGMFTHGYPPAQRECHACAYSAWRYSGAWHQAAVSAHQAKGRAGLSAQTR